MITETQMYWLTRLDYLQGFFIGAGLAGIMVFTIAISITLIAKSDASSGEKKKYNKLTKLWIVCLLLSTLSIFISCFVPDTKEMCAIKVVPMIVNDPNVQDLPNKVVDIANDWLDELKPKKNGD